MPPPDPEAPAPAGGDDPRDSSALDVVAYYHHPVKAPLLREVMLPLAASVSVSADGTDGGIAAHVERHWLHGPHLRLRLQGTDPARVAHTAEAAAARIRARLRAHPSHSDLTEAQLLERAAESGRAELVPRPTGRSTPTTRSGSSPSTGPSYGACSERTGPDCGRTCCGPAWTPCAPAPNSSAATRTPTGPGSASR